MWKRVAIRGFAFVPQPWDRLQGVQRDSNNRDWPPCVQFYLIVEEITSRRQQNDRDHYYSPQHVRFRSHFLKISVTVHCILYRKKRESDNICTFSKRQCHDAHCTLRIHQVTFVIPLCIRATLFHLKLDSVWPPCTSLYLDDRLQFATKLSILPGKLTPNI